MKLSKSVVALILSGASASVILPQFLAEKEGYKLTAYKDGAGIWTICSGLTRYKNKPVTKGMKLTKNECDIANKIESDKALAWVAKNVSIPLTEAQKVGIASFCPYNIGSGKCLNSTFFKRLKSDNKTAACDQIKLWIFDGGRDCRIRKNGCYGQVERRDQEVELLCGNL